MDAIAFQARARTIDHLGREQIADCPTAVSELWKNSYDAYARAVHLHILDGEICSAALVDDGHGMTRDEFVDKWLVLGTESKASGISVPREDRNGLDERQRQGQKGIGRLSAAALGPLMLFISKREGNAFVASLIDWRLFQNPFLLLNDIKIPIVEFSLNDELQPLLDQMFDRLMGNIWGDAEDEERTNRLAKAWQQFDSLELQEQKESTRAAVERVLLQTSISERQLGLWPVWKGERPHGTAMIVLDIAFDLKAQLSVGHNVSDEAATISSRSRLRNTLLNFTDPYQGSFAQPGTPTVSGMPVETASIDLQFNYGVTAWEGALNRSIVADVREFGLENLEALEHVIDGWIDSAGVFHGRVKAFGKWMSGEIMIAPAAPVGNRKDSRVGPFSLRLGTFEQELKNTTHEKSIHAGLLDRADSIAGFLVFRDGLRVLPYGREDNDFFEIERRRGMHAGREFWSIRRIFGRVALTRENNGNLKDKAGREGFIDNKAAKVFRDLIENILKVTARRYFGSDSLVRKDLLPQINASFNQVKAEEAQKKLNARRRKDFRKNLDLFSPEASAIRKELDGLVQSARSDSLPETEDGLMALRKQVEELRERQNQLTLGPPPSKLGPLEPAFKEFRGNMGRALEMVGQLRDSISVAIDRIKPKSQDEIAHAELARNAAYLHGRIRKWGVESKNLLNTESLRLNALIDDRNKQYHAVTLPLLHSLQSGGAGLSEVLASLDREKELQDQENEELFTGYISTLRSLAENIDLESLAAFSIDENTTHREEIQRLNALAQLGITVEILSHEVAGFEGAITDGLRKLPEQVKHSSAYLAIKHGHESLSDRLRFLSPLKLSGERSSQWIKGAEIANFVESILELPLVHSQVKLIQTSAFGKFSVFDQFARVMPVFINLVNNAIYWAARTSAAEKIVLLDAFDGQVFVSDNGPGVDSDDIQSLFSLFFTRKLRGGRGVGLYLCRANLASGGHSIEYITAADKKRLPGANFAIRFNGVKYE